MSSRNGNNNKNKFVVKLGLSSDGEAGPFRRLAFPKFVGSHKRICDAAAELAVGESGACAVQYKLRLTFKDEDGDSCLLLNDPDIKLAVSDTKKPLKVFAEILELSAVPADPPSVPAPEPTVQTRSVENGIATPPASSSTAPSTTSSNDQQPPALHQAVESIVGVLANAVVGLQNSMDDAAANHPGTDNNTAPVTSDSRETAETEETLPEEEERPFIHGRHTCDSCLTTPIVGKRFHAVNMQDYDMCENCHGNYSGTEIQFEEAELERDRPMQERWHRRYAKWGTAGRPHFRKHGGRGGRFPVPRGRGRFGPPHGHPHGPPQPHGPHHHGPPPPFAPYGSPPPCAPHHEIQPQDVDAALKEAIRRSMEDVKEAETQTEAKQTNTEAVQTEPKESAEIAVQTKEAEVVVENEPEIVVEAEQKPPASEKSLDSAKSTPSKASTSSEDEFTLDAAGNGDVAAVLGETMDKIAFAIQEMNVELERESSNSNDDSDDDSDKESEIVVETVDEDDDKAGAVIVGGDEPNDDEISQNSWDVVEDQVAHDESLARAAQVIGSALFNSGMSDSHAHSQGNGSNVSVGSSVPTDLPSITSDNAAAYTPDALLQRWAPQLAQLHEIGFRNDALLVETLERLEAADIGSGETGPISVTRVVNEMMRDRW